MAGNLLILTRPIKQNQSRLPSEFLWGLQLTQSFLVIKYDKNKMNYNKKRIGLLYLQNAPLFSKRRFWLIMLFLWMYTAAWIGVLIYISFFWDANWYKKAIPLILLIIGTPTIEDLLMGYKRYKNKWEEHNRVPSEDSFDKLDN